MEVFNQVKLFLIFGCLLSNVKKQRGLIDNQYPGNGLTILIKAEIESEVSKTSFLSKIAFSSFEIMQLSSNFLNVNKN